MIARVINVIGITFYVIISLRALKIALKKRMRISDNQPGINKTQPY